MSEPQESIGVRDLPAMTVTTPDRETEFGHEEPVSRFDAPGFDYDAATQPQPNRAYLPEPAAPGGAACAGHPGNAARIVCDRCGDFMCRLCATPVEGHTYCPACFTLLHSQGSLAFTQKSFTAPAVCLGLGIASVVASCNLMVGPVLGIAGLVAGAQARKRMRAQPDLPGGKLISWGVALSLLGILLGSGWVVLIIWSALT